MLTYSFSHDSSAKHCIGNRMATSLAVLLLYNKLETMHDYNMASLEFKYITNIIKRNSQLSYLLAQVHSTHTRPQNQLSSMDLFLLFFLSYLLFFSSLFVE